MLDGAGAGPRGAGARRGRIGALALGGAVLYLAAVAGAWIALRELGDRWWPATLLLFGPRWALGLPLLALVPLALSTRRGALIPLAAAAAIVVGPIMDLSLGGLLLAAPRRGDLRVATFNAEGRRAEALGVPAFVDDVRPDVLVIQECGDRTEHLARGFPGWAVHGDLGMCVISRHPIRTIEARDRADAWARGGNGAVDRYAVDVPAPGGASGGKRALRRVTVVNVHLETAREAIEALLRGAWRAAGEHDANVAQRAWESEIARQWARGGEGAVVVAGDFNMPVESAIYRRTWGDLENAFSSAGLGFGATKRTRWFGTRIDHVLAGPGLRAAGAWVGPDLGSDHRPMIADLVWTDAR